MSKSQCPAALDAKGFLRFGPSVRHSLVLGTWSLVIGHFVALLLLPTPTAAQERDELASFKIAPGFEVNLFASESNGVVKPIQCRWDARGRLWVIGSTVYPQLQPGEVPDDKVIILEDTDRDGRADKTTVFAHGLMIPTGIELDGDARGCFLGEGTQLLHLRDNDGDGVADEKTVVLRGFGTGDNHQNINSFRWSPGGELFFCQGLHARARVETPFGIVALDEAGFWRMRPRQLRLDAFYGGPAEPQNPWGVIFTDWGQPLINAGNNGGVSYPVPEMIRGHSIGGRENIWVNARGRKTSGPDIVANSHWPAEWQGALILGGYINNAVWALKIEDDGAGFRVSDLPPLITSTDTRFRPVDVKFGPDGALYIADWFNPIIGHYQASFRHPDRDKTHGRIWRVTAKGRPLVTPPKLIGASLASVLDQLKSPERWNVEQARRVLSAAETKQVMKALQKWLPGVRPSPGAAASDRTRAPGPANTAAPGDGRTPAELSVEHQLFEALALCESHDVVEPALLERLLAAKEPNARAYAAGVIARWSDRLDKPLDLLTPLALDTHPRVRLAAIVAAANIPGARALDLTLQSLDQPTDKFIDLALRQTVYALKPHWLPALTSGQLEAAKHPTRLEFLVKADGTPDTLRALRSLLQSRAGVSPDPPSREALFLSLAEVGSPDDLALLLRTNTFTGARGYDAALHARVLGKLRDSCDVRAVKPAGDLGEVLGTLGASRELQILALQLIGQWGVKSLWTNAHATAFSTTDDETRNAAATALAMLPGELTTQALNDLFSTNRPIGQRLAGAVGLASPAGAYDAAAALLATGQLNETQVRMLLTANLYRWGSSLFLAQALTKQKPARDSARLALRHLQSIGRLDKELLTILTDAAALGGEPLKASPDFVTQLAVEVRDRGDAKRGAELFRRADLNCVTCHSIAGQGGNIGPALDTIGSGQPLEFIIGAVLEPNKEVKESYEAIEVTMKNGDTHQGYRLRADNREVLMRDVALNKEVRLRRDQIAEQRARGSLMPPGLVDHLTREELRDLFSFLSELGRAAR